LLFVQHRAIWAFEHNVEGHLAGGMRGTGEARIEGADACLNAVQHTLGNLGAMDIVSGDLGNRTVHGQIVLPCGNDKIDPLNKATLVHLVMMEERTPWRLTHADALQAIDTGAGSQARGGKVWIVQEDIHSFDGGQDLDKPGVVVHEA